MLNDFVGFRLAQLRFQARLGFLERYHTLLLDLSIFMMQGRVGLETNAVDSTYGYSISGLGHSNRSRSRFASFHNSGLCSTVGKRFCKALCRSSSLASRTRPQAGSKFRRNTSQTVGSTSCRI